jgi:site-specific recombinase XerD
LNWRQQIGPPRPHDSIEWRPFASALSARSIAYALSVLGALFRWLIAQRYVLANPFAGIKVRGSLRGATLDTSRGFTEDEWVSVRNIADELEDSQGWAEPAARRLRFLLDFAYATGLRISELVNATLGNIQTDEHDDHWLYMVGKGSKAGKVSLPPLARTALDQYLVQRGLSVLPARWNPKMSLIANLDKDGTNGISSARLWGSPQKTENKAR